MKLVDLNLTAYTDLNDIKILITLKNYLEIILKFIIN